MRTANRAATAAASGALTGALCLCLLTLAFSPSSQAALSPSAYRVGALCSGPRPATPAAWDCGS